MRIVASIVMGLATASLIACSQKSPAADIGARLAAQDRANEQQHREQLARLARIDAVVVHEDDRSIEIAFTMRNLAEKRVASLDVGFESDGPDGTRIGMAELRSVATIPPRTARHLSLTVPYTQFGEDTGAMREAEGKPQRYAVDIKEIRYADGSEVGFDD